MALINFRFALIAGLLALGGVPALSAQVFVVGEKSATADIATDFTPTNVQLPTEKMTELGRRELIRTLEDEQGFAHRALPISAGLVLRANGRLSPDPAAYKEMLYKKGQAAGVGDRVMITAMEFKEDRIILDLNGGPYLKHRFLRHVQLNDNPVAADTGETATGSRITLLFSGPVPNISAPEVKSLLAPVIDFGVHTSDQAYADTLPPLVKDAVLSHEVLVGMTHRMVLAAMGAPENKIREAPSGDPNGATCEEWIYGHVPQTVRFIRFDGDRVTMVEIAALGKPLEIHDKDEMGGFNPPVPTREVAMGDHEPGASDAAAPPPTLRKPGEAAPPAGNSGKVQFPTDGQPDASSSTAPSVTTPTAPKLL